MRRPVSDFGGVSINPYPQLLSLQCGNDTQDVTRLHGNHFAHEGGGAVPHFAGLEIHLDPETNQFAALRVKT